MIGLIQNIRERLPESTLVNILAELMNCGENAKTMKAKKNREDKIKGLFLATTFRPIIRKKLAAIAQNSIKNIFIISF